MLFCAVLRHISARFGLTVFVPPLRPPCVAVSYFSLENKHGFFRGRKKLTNILDLSFHEVLENFHI